MNHLGKLFPNPHEFDACGSERTLYEITKIQKKCYVGIVLSQISMLSSIALIFPMENNHYYIYTHSFIFHEQERKETQLSQCWAWRDYGLLTVMRSHRHVIQYLEELKAAFGLNFLGIGINHHHAGNAMEDLEKFGCPTEFITQSARNLDNETRKFVLCVRNHKCEYHKQNKLLRLSALNAEIIENSFGEIKVVKCHPNKRQSPTSSVDAVLNAFVLKSMMKR